MSFGTRVRLCAAATLLAGLAPAWAADVFVQTPDQAAWQADKKTQQKFYGPYSEMMAKMFMAQLQADPALAEELRKRKPKEFAEMMAKYGGR